MYHTRSVAVVVDQKTMQNKEYVATAPQDIFL